MRKIFTKYSKLYKRTVCLTDDCLKLCLNIDFCTIYNN